MALLAKSLKSLEFIQISRTLYAAQVRQASHFYPYYKPGPYPKTKEEREAAAKKYNLLPEEYEPYPDDGYGLGDYPKLPLESVDAKDPYHNWDFPETRRDYMEPVHYRLVNLFPEAYSTAPLKFSHKLGFFIYSAGILAVAVLYYAISGITVNEPLLEKQHPKSGVTHYTFELDAELGKLLRKPKCVCD